MTSRTFQWKYAVERVIGSILALILLRSATAHAGNSYFFLSTIYAYQIASERIGLFVAATLPSVQIAFALCLLLRWWIRSTYLGLTVLFVGFIAIQSTALYRGFDISCGCFGAGDSLSIGPSTLAVASASALTSILGFYLSRHDHSQRGE